MRGILLESARVRRSANAGIAASASAHVLIIVIAVMATASAATTPGREAATVVIPVFRTDPGIRQSSPSATPAARPRRVKPAPAATIPVAPAAVSSAITEVLPAPAAPGAPEAGEAGATGAAPGEQLLSVDSGPYDASQVDIAARASRNSVQPRYPFALQTRGIEGAVQAEFVVDENGRAELSTLRMLSSAHELFAAAIRDALPRMRFYPAQVAGKPVKQLVQQTFQFRIER